MDISNFSKKLFLSILDYGKVVFLITLNKDDKNLFCEFGFSARGVNRLNLEFKNILIEQHEEYLDYIKNEEESVNEKLFE